MPSPDFAPARSNPPRFSTDLGGFGVFCSPRLLCPANAWNRTADAASPTPLFTLSIGSNASTLPCEGVVVWFSGCGDMNCLKVACLESQVVEASTGH
jgi:hypothetical protein